MRRASLWRAGAVVVGLALLLAFPLRDVFQRTVIVPLAYLFWAVGILYRIMPQLMSWALAVLVVVLLLVGSLIPQGVRLRRRLEAEKPAQGPVEQLSSAMARAGEGRYFKWLVANRLGRLAHTLLSQREGDTHRSVFATLAGSGWEPPRRLQEYLDTGLHGSFSDYPQPRRTLGAAGPAEDPEIEEAVTFLEGQLELHRDRRR